jgi:lipoprotein-releasing system ATP-binding protein
MNDRLLPAGTPVLAARSVQKHYLQGRQRVDVLRDVDMAVHAGESVAVIGTSGSGKSTLLHILGGLDVASGGQVLMDGQDWQSLGEAARCALRNQGLGFVYQFHHLLPEFTAQENVAMPLLIRRTPRPEALRAAAALLEQVGLGHRLCHRPGELSGGERQRTAIARALAGQPACILADEPTGNLDRATAREIFALFREMNSLRKTALVIVTHDRELAAGLDRQLALRDGRLVEA